MSDKLTVDVLDAKGEKSGKVDLPNDLFNVQTNVPLIHQVVVAQQAAARQGTHSTKTRGEVAGGGRKPWRQKGTGRARQGSIRAVQWTGGGIAHGPKPRDYAQRTPKKMVAAALRGALSDRARDGQIVVLKSIVSGDTPSTKKALAALKNVGEVNKLLVVLDRSEDLAWLSLRNVAEVHVISVDQLNTYDVIANDKVVFTSAAFETFVQGAPQGKTVKAVASESEIETKDLKSVKKTKLSEDADVTDSYRGDNPPEEFSIKANENTKKYHLPSSPWYSRTSTSLWFKTAEAAEAAGFVNAKPEEDGK